MTTIQSSLSGLIDDLDPSRARFELNEPKAKIAEFTPPSSIRFEFLGVTLKKQHLILFAASIASGLLFGLVIVGLWLLPVRTSSGLNPVQWSPDYQKLFVTWAADNYWQTGNSAQAQAAFADWNPADLAQLLSTMQQETNDTETRRRLLALTQALQIPVSDTSLSSFASQPIIILGVLLSAMPLLVALALVSLPRLRKREQVIEGVPAEAIRSEERLDDLIGLESVDALELADQEQNKEEEEKKEEEAAEEADDQSAGLGDLASLFEEEDTSINVLEAFCKGMPEINVDDLLATAKDMVFQLRQGDRVPVAK